MLKRRIQNHRERLFCSIIPSHRGYRHDAQEKASNRVPGSVFAPERILFDASIRGHGTGVRRKRDKST